MNTWLSIIQAATIFAAAISGALAWAAKLQWSREFAAAKDERIKARDDHIEALKLELERQVSGTLLDNYDRMKQRLEERNMGLQAELANAQQQTADLRRKLEHEIAKKEENASVIIKLKEELDLSQHRIEQLTAASNDWQEKVDTLNSDAHELLELEARLPRTIADAIGQVLRANREPMTIPEIHEAIERGKLYVFNSRTPQHIVRTQLRRHTVGVHARGSARVKLFGLTADNRYYLLPHEVAVQETRSA
jgi:predicted RNase H-like nuclease (RuvC/YqgF family)